MFKITYFPTGPANKSNGIVVSYTKLSEMSDKFKKCNKGPKLNAYFVRGELSPLVRADDNLDHSRIIILDIDKGKDNGCALSPKEMHQILTDLGYIHFLYTSHSHKSGDNRFRVVLLAERDYVKNESKATVDALFEELWGKGANCKNVSESKNWSQPWFLPFRDDPNDGLYEFYELKKGKNVKIIGDSGHKKEEKNDEKNKNDDPERKSWRDRLQEITDGVNFHENIRNVSWALSNEGTQKNAIILMLQIAMNSCSNKDERWKQRYSDIERLVSGALDKQDRDKRITIDDIKISGDPIVRDVPWPPGLFGDLVEDAYMMARFRYREVALVSALGLLAGICGRRFNVSGTGLNIYLTLIMGTGMGKEQIRDFINKTLMSLGDKGQVSSSFIGPGKFNSYKAAVHTLKDARSQVCVFTEAGIMFKSAGDQASVTKALLHLYTCSGANQYSIGESFSDSDKNVPVLKSPALSIISESTPESLLSVFLEQGAGQQGDLPRQSIFRLVGGKPYADLNPQQEVRPECKEKLRDLVKKCSAIQASDDYVVFDMNSASEDVLASMVEFSKYCTDMENEYRDIDTMRSYMYSRLFIKALKFSALASVFNYKDYPYIPMKEWLWGKDLAMYEMEGLGNLFANTSSGDIIHDLAKNVVGNYIIKILRGELKGEKYQLDRDKIERGIVPVSILYHSLKNNRRLKEFDTFSKFNPSVKTGFEKIIKWMVDNRYLHELELAQYRVRCVKITDEFRLLMS